MTRAQFLNDLYHHLYGMTREQAEQHLTYYAEMLADRMEEGMTEEEAVAGMEAVETIARRILEEEGLPYTPPEQRPVTPPEYPDASQLKGGGGTRAYQAPRRMNWRRAAQIVLWVVAIAVAMGTARHWIWRWNTADSAKTSDIPVDRTDTIVEEASPVPELPPYYIEQYDGYYQDAPYMAGYEYGSGAFSYSGDIRSIDIQWASGIVYIQSWSGDEVQIQEYASTELSERTAMSCREDGGTLTIRYRESTGLGSVKGGKWLTVLVPDGMLDDLKVETTSANIDLNGLELGTLSAFTTSGYVTPKECYTQKAELTSTSGEMLLSQLYAEELTVNTTSGCIDTDFHGTNIQAFSMSGDIDVDILACAGNVQLGSTSGDVWINMEDSSTRSIVINTVSGDVFLNLPYDNMGYSLDYASVSGDLQVSTGYDLLQQNGKYIHNGGGCEIQVVTVSGDFEIY